MKMSPNEKNSHPAATEREKNYNMLVEDRKTINELRVLEGLGPLPGGDAKLILEDKILSCPKCEREYKKSDFFYTDHKYSLKNYQMCFHCCRMILGHAGYGE